MTSADLIPTLTAIDTVLPRGDRTSVPSARRTSGLTSTLEHLLDGKGDHRWSDLATFDPAESDALQTLLVIYDLWTAPLRVTRGREVHQLHPAVCSLKQALEEQLIDRLDHRSAEDDTTGDIVDRFRRIASANRVPRIYDWVADSAELPEIRAFIALEGGPDAQFDDLVALAQIGIEGDAKVALATNYWDEMGRGDSSEVHTELHHQMAGAMALSDIRRDDAGTGMLERQALNGLLVTNRYLQPEALGAFGLLEMQAGPRCRAVVRGLRRVEAPEAALPFYEEHARADPLHGKDWLDRVIAPLSVDPAWGERMVRGARWRQAANDRFLAEAEVVLEVGLTDR